MGDFDYSLGVLIVLILVFWSMCKCMGGTQKNPDYVYYKRPMVRRSPKVGYEKIIELQLPTKCPHAQGAHDMSAVPVSNTSTRDLIDSEGQYTEGMISYDEDNGCASMHMTKKTNENCLNVPSSLTKARQYVSTDRSDRIGMSPY